MSEPTDYELGYAKGYADGMQAYIEEISKLKERLSETHEMYMEEQLLRHEYGTRLAQLESRR